MDPKTRVVAVAGALSMLIVVIELVRRRRLKEEYSVLWVLTAVVMVVLAVWYELLLEITSAIGAVLPTSTLFFFGLGFALAMLLHFSVRVSALERRVTMLVQEVALMNVPDADAVPDEDDPITLPHREKLGEPHP